jgi:hypothetical protein
MIAAFVAELLNFLLLPLIVIVLVEEVEFDAF